MTDFLKDWQHLDPGIDSVIFNAQEVYIRYENWEVST